MLLNWALGSSQFTPSLFCTRSHAVQAGLKCPIVAKNGLELWSSHLYLLSAGLGLCYFNWLMQCSKPALCVLGKHSAHWATSPALQPLPSDPMGND